MYTARISGALLPAIMALTLSPPLVRADRGTFFALEMDGGTSFPLDMDSELPGYAMRIAVGVGGKPAGWKPLFYFNAAYAVGKNTFPGSTLTLSRSTDSLLFGPRVVVPVVGHLRVFAEALIGPGWVSAEIQGAGGDEPYESNDVFFAYALGSGLQYRLARLLSLGLRAELADEIAGSGPDAGAVLVTGGQGDTGLRLGASAFATLHF